MKTKNNRLGRLRPYPFAALNMARDAAVKAGMDVIDMGVGNPDMRPHPKVIEEFKGHLFTVKDDAALFAVPSPFDAVK